MPIFLCTVFFFQIPTWENIPIDFLTQPQTVAVVPGTHLLYVGGSELVAAGTDNNGIWLETDMSCLQVRGAAPDRQTVFAVSSGPISHQLQRTSDAGQTWDVVSTPPGLLGHHLAVSPFHDGLIFMWNGAAFHRSNDGGVTWSTSALLAGASDVVVDRGNGAFVYALDPVSATFYFSGNKGADWLGLPSGMAGGSNGGFGGWALGAETFAFIDATLYHLSGIAGPAENVWQAPAGAVIEGLVVDPRDPNRLMVLTQGADGAQLFASDTGPDDLISTELPDVSVRDMAYDPIRRKLFVIGADGLFAAHFCTARDTVDAWLPQWPTRTVPDMVPDFGALCEETF